MLYKTGYITMVVVFSTTLSRLVAQDLVIDSERSTVTIRVGRAGLFSAAGHDHWVLAPIASGRLRESAPQHVEFTVETAKMTVKPDPKVDAKTQAQIQNDMEEITLEIRKYPAIAFQSTKIEPAGQGKWRVEGTLSLHGVTRPISLTVERSGEAYTSHTVLKQTDFGIKPVSIGGGVVKVKNEVDIEFQIYARTL
jgi:polyisoprenoid-binding protein YceI